MADTSNNVPRVSRRMWLAGLGGGLLSLPFLYWFDVGRVTSLTPSQEAGTPSATYVDRDGWMLTVEDAAALAARPPGQ